MKISCLRCLIHACNHRSVSSKYSPLPWEGHFDEELKVAIPDSDDVSISFNILLMFSDCWNLFKMFGFILPYSNVHLIGDSSLTRAPFDRDFLRWMMPCVYFVHLELSFLLQILVSFLAIHHWAVVFLGLLTGLQFVLSRITRASSILPAWWWLYGVIYSSITSLGEGLDFKVYSLHQFASENDSDGWLWRFFTILSLLQRTCK